MSSIKVVGLMGATGAVVAGGTSLYRGMKVRNQMLEQAKTVAGPDGKIPTGGMTKDGKLWDGYTTLDNIKKDSKKAVMIGSSFSAAAGAIATAVVSGLTLLAKSHLK